MHRAARRYETGSGGGDADYVRCRENEVQLPGIEGTAARGQTIVDRTTRWNIGNLAMLRPSKNSNEGNDRVSSAAQPTADSIVREAVHQTGQPLDAAWRAYFEPRFGADFSQVRIHTGERAAESARSIDALAYTVGTDIVLGAGARQASSGARSRLMAHELAHVAQQGGSKASRAQHMAMTSPGDATEREAEAAATAVSRGASYHLARGNTGAIARQSSEAETMPGAEAPSPPVPMGGQGAATRPARPSSSSFLTAYSKIGYNVWKGEEQRHNVWAFVGGSVGKTFDGENTCATRVSYGLDYGGSPIKGFDNTFSYHNYSTVSFEGKAGDDQNYIVDALAMATYFLKHYGAPDAHLSKGQDGLDFEGSAKRQVRGLRGHASLQCHQRRQLPRSLCDERSRCPAGRRPDS